MAGRVPHPSHDGIHHTGEERSEDHPAEEGERNQQQEAGGEDGDRDPRGQRDAAQHGQEIDLDSAEGAEGEKLPVSVEAGHAYGFIVGRVVPEKQSHEL